MEGLTVSEIANLLKIPVQTAARRIERAGIKPLTREAVFPFDTPEKIRDANKRGRPPKAKPEDPARAAKSAKNGKK
jgi:predicted RNA polymerase sigma factor